MRSELEVIEMYNAGMTVTKICAELFLHPPQVYACLRKHGVPLRSEVAAYAGVMASTPQDLTSLQVKTGVSAEDIRKVLDSVTVEGRRGVASKVLGDIRVITLVTSLYEDAGMSAKEIATSLGLKYHNVLRMLRNAKVQVVPGRGNSRWKRLRETILADLTEGELSPEEVLIKHGIPAAAITTLIQDGDLHKAQWSRPQFMETVINEVMQRIQEQYGLHVLDKGGGVQMKLFDFEQ